MVEGAADFEPKHIFECGQCFRWSEEDDGSYTGVALHRVINVRKQDCNLVIGNTSLSDFYNTWYDYFDLGRDYGAIKKELSSDDVLSEAARFGDGIRILKQDESETLISFIISSNNRIPMIKREVGRLSEGWGDPIRYRGRTYYTFPSLEKLAQASVEEIKSCGMGFRAQYIKDTCRIILDDDIPLYRMKDMDYRKARKILMGLPGVGPKVSDCVLLFSMRHYEAFPVDVWVKRVMRHYYLAPDVSLPKIELYAQQRFGGLAGFAQQYLFYFARDLKGKEISD